MEGSKNGSETVLVTGGSGFLGGWCLRELLGSGYRVRTTVRDPSREPEIRAMLAPEGDVADRLSVRVADLSTDAGWDEAVDGCDYVLHVASPFPPEQPKDPDDLIVPAREGTLRVLRAAPRRGRNGSLSPPRPRRSPTAARTSRHCPLDRGRLDRPGKSRLTPYARSKTIAEQAAWDLVPREWRLQRLTVVNPSAILGPVFYDDRRTRCR